MEKQRVQYLVAKKKDIRSSYRDLLLTGITSELAKETGLAEKVGVVFKLRNSIATAVARFTAINQGTFQTEVDRPKRLLVAEEAIARVEALAIQDADEKVHYEILLNDFNAKLKASIAAAIERFTAANQDFQKITEMPHRLEKAEEASKKIDTLHLDEDGAVHYGVLLQEFIVKLQVSIETAEKLYAAKEFVERSKNEDPKFIIAAIKEEIKNIDKLGIVEVDTRSHYYNLLKDFCNILEKQLRIAITQFKAYGFSDIANPFERLRKMQTARRMLSTTSTSTVPPYMLTQFQAAARVASSSEAVILTAVPANAVNLGELPKPAMQAR